MYKRSRIYFIFFALLFTSCIGTLKGTLKELNTVQKLGSLAPGMSHRQVCQIIGQPKSSEFVGDTWVLNYTLCDYLKGPMPYRVVFDKNTKKLVSWYADEEKYRKNKEKVTKVIKSIQEKLEKKKSANE